MRLGVAGVGRDRRAVARESASSSRPSESSASPRASATRVPVWTCIARENQRPDRHVREVAPAGRQAPPERSRVDAGSATAERAARSIACTSRLRSGTASSLS